MIKIGLSVQKFCTYDVKHNIKVIEKSAREARILSVDILCFGEAVLQGFYSMSGNYDSDIGIAVFKNGKEISQIKQKAKEEAIAIALGYIERENDSIFSSYIVIDNNGREACNFRRVSRGWKEPHWNAHYKEGQSFCCFDLFDRKFGVGLCGDFWMDDDKLPNYQNDYVLWPVYIDTEYAEWQNGTAIAEYASQAKKISKNVFLVNSILSDNKHSASGRAIYFSQGKIKSQLDIAQKGILVCEI